MTSVSWFGVVLVLRCLVIFNSTNLGRVRLSHGGRYGRTMVVGFAPVRTVNIASKVLLHIIELILLLASVNLNV